MLQDHEIPTRQEGIGATERQARLNKMVELADQELAQELQSQELATNLQAGPTLNPQPQVGNQTINPIVIRESESEDDVAVAPKKAASSHRSKSARAGSSRSRKTNRSVKTKPMPRSGVSRRTSKKTERSEHDSTTDESDEETASDDSDETEY